MVEQGSAPLRQCQFLVDHGQDAAVARVDSDDCAVHVAEGIDGRLTHNRVFSADAVAIGQVKVSKGVAGESLVASDAGAQ